MFRTKLTESSALLARLTSGLRLAPSSSLGGVNSLHKCVHSPFGVGFVVVTQINNVAFHEHQWDLHMLLYQVVKMNLPKALVAARPCHVHHAAVYIILFDSVQDTLNP